MGLHDMLQGAPQQQAQADPQQAMQQIDTLIQAVQSIRDEETYQQAVQQYQQMGGDVTELSPNYDPREVAEFLQLLVQAKQELAAQMQPQSGIAGLTGGA